MSNEHVVGGRPVPATPPLASLGQLLASPRLGALVTIVAAAALGAGLIVWSLQPAYVPLGEQSSRGDALEIVELLGTSGVDYRLDPGTGLVLVPKDALARVRMDLAAAGLGERTPVGFELLGEDQALGTSHFTETARYQHALEVELGRTIGSLRNVESARVHLALPKPSVFVRERGSASASVTIKARPGRTIEDEQVAAVVNLVAASIPDLENGQVTVVDQWGRLLSRSDESTGDASRERYEHARRLERLYSERIESLLEPIVGPGRVRATVTAELDFSVNERTEEAFEADPAKLRSEQSETRVTAAGGTEGIPGALSNQPPGDGFVEGEEVPDDADPAVEPTDRSETTTRNFELDKTITHVRQTPGGVSRLSAAVVIDDRESVGADGEVVRTPLTPEEIEEYTALAREAIGFDAGRGDSVSVLNRAFRPLEDVPPIEPLPVWQQDWVWTMVRQSLTGLAVLLLVLLVVRPAVRRLALASSPANGALERDGVDGAGTDSDDAALPDGTNEERRDGAKGEHRLENPPVVYGDILNMARALAAEDPKRVAKVVKDWVGEP